VLRLAAEVDSICLHGDTPDCLEFAELVVKTLLDAGYGVGAA
jgi:lactam utilization protein B